MNLLDNTNQDDHIQIDQNIDPLEALTSPGAKFDRSKYQSEADMYKAIAKGKLEADNYLEHFKARHDELKQDYTKLRDEYNAGPSLKELIDQFKSAKESNTDNTQSGNEDKSVFDAEKYQEMIRSEIAKTKQQEREEANFESVQSKLRESYGPNYQNALKQQVSSLGLSADFVNDLARKHPQVLFKTLGLDGQRQTENFQAPLQSTTRSDPFGSSTPKRTFAYYEKMRKANPTEYFNPKTQDQMFKDSVALGDAFNDGGFTKVWST